MAKGQKHFTHLTTVKQEAGESLTEFLVCWRVEEADVENIDDKSAIVMFIDALRAGNSTRRKTPSTYAALKVKADRYAEVEEANRLKGSGEENPAKKPQVEELVKKKVMSPPIEKNSLGKGKVILNSVPQNPIGIQRVPPPWDHCPPAKAPFTTPFIPLKAHPSEILAYSEECQVVKASD